MRMTRNKSGAPRRRKPPRFRVSAAEKAELIQASQEADLGGSLPFDQAMAEVERMTDEILAVVEAPSSPPK